MHEATDGEFKGWRTWTRDSYETHTGPFWHRTEEDGRVRCAFRVERKHLNGSGNVHGGCFMTFADYCLFALASHELHGPAVTVSFASAVACVASAAGNRPVKPVNAVVVEPAPVPPTAAASTSALSAVCNDDWLIPRQAMPSAWLSVSS